MGCVLVVTYISGTRPQEVGSKVFQHLPCLFDIRHHLLSHLALPIFPFISSFHLLHLLLLTLQSALHKDCPAAIPGGCSTQVLHSPHSPLKVSPGLQGGRTRGYSPRHRQTSVTTYCLPVIPGASHLGLNLQWQRQLPQPWCLQTQLTPLSYFMRCHGGSRCALRTIRKTRMVSQREKAAAGWDHYE